MLKSYFIYHPFTAGSVEDEWNQCLKQIEKTRLSGYTPVKLNIFVDESDFGSFLSTRESVTKSLTISFRLSYPTINITVNPPEVPFKVAVEAAFIISNTVRIVYKSFNSIPYIVLEAERAKEIWAGGVSSYLYPDDTRRGAENAFDLMIALLDKEKMSLNHLVRQWNYIGNILKINNGSQNYQIFNEVRGDYYQRFRTVQGYPAATGVGTKHGGVILDFCAVKSDDSILIKPVDNPRQIRAYNYSQQVLRGIPGRDKARTAPKFERALLLAYSEHSTLYISGTASIIGQETIGSEDIEKQTNISIENIKRLTDAENIRHMISGQLFNCEEISLLRVYIKKQSDFSIVRQIVNLHFPQVPAIFIEADICRDDLLIEIEAEVKLKC